MTDTQNFTPNGETTSVTYEETSTFSATTLPDEMVIAAVERACNFFEIPEVPVINADGTCVWPNDSSTLEDDVFGFNREELMHLGISGEDSLTLIYTHECAHRTLQGEYNDSWKEELACDFFAGLHAGLGKIKIDNFEAALGTTTGGDSHPNGALRAEFIEYGRQIGQDYEARGVEVTYEECIEIINDHLEAKESLIEEYRSRIDPNASIDDNDHLSTDSDAKSFVNDKAWHEKQAKENLEWANWHRSQAEKAADRGDHASAKDHISRAKTYDAKAKDYMRSAGMCTK